MKTSSAQRRGCYNYVNHFFVYSGHLFKCATHQRSGEYGSGWNHYEHELGGHGDDRPADSHADWSFLLAIHCRRRHIQHVYRDTQSAVSSGTFTVSTSDNTTSLVTVPPSVAVSVRNRLPLYL